jgi:PAS domain S-box-containing protein
MGDVTKDNQKTKEQLVHELSELRSQNAELIKSITGTISAELAAEAISRYAESIVETVREPLLVLDADLKIISANRNFYRTFKVAPGETIGSFIYDLGNKQWDIPELRRMLEEILPDQEAFEDFEVTHDFQVIGHKVMLLNARQIYRKDIDARMILLAIEDITERTRLEDSLSDSEERFRRLFETASDGIVLLEKGEGKITQSNPAAEKMLGYNQKESIGNKLPDIGVLLDLGDFQTTMQHLNERGIVRYDDVLAQTKSGRCIDTDIYLVDRAKLVQCNIRDITERKRAEETLRKNEEIYRLVVDNMADVITIMDLNLSFTYVSPSIIRLRGYTAEEVMSQTMEQIMTPESLQVVARVFEEELALEASDTADPARTRILELEEYRKDGSSVWLESHMSALRNDEKKLIGIIALSSDITKRKQAEDKIKKQTDAMEAAIDGMALLNKDGEYIYLNQAHAMIYGYENTGELIGKSWRTLYDADEIKRFDAAIMPKFSQEGSWQGEALGMKKDGSKFPQGISLTALDGGGLICVVRDITERKQSEEKLLQTIESIRKAIGTTIQVMISAIEVRDPYTSGHQIRSTNLARAIATEMGLSREKIEGLRMAGSIHDIGKLSIPAEILSKPTKLSEIEYALIKEHAHKGFEMLKDVESPWPLAEIVYQHHERMDGLGYPRHLKGNDILIEARILTVADVVEAMASHRPYRPSLGIDEALKEIEKNRGIFYDVAVVDACLKLFREKGFQLAVA